MLRKDVKEVMSTENRQPKQLLLLDSVWSAEHKMCSNVTEYFMNTIYNAFFLYSMLNVLCTKYKCNRKLK